MSYNPTVWVDNHTYLDADNLNKIEQQLVKLDREIINTECIDVPENLYGDTEAFNIRKAKMQIVDNICYFLVEYSLQEGYEIPSHVWDKIILQKVPMLIKILASEDPYNPSGFFTSFQGREYWVGNTYGTPHLRVKNIANMTSETVYKFRLSYPIDTEWYLKYFSKMASREIIDIEETIE